MWIPAVPQNQRGIPQPCTAPHHSMVTLTIQHLTVQLLPSHSQHPLQVARSHWSNEDQDNNHRSKLQCFAQFLCKIQPPSPNSDNRPPFQSLEYKEICSKTAFIEYWCPPPSITGWFSRKVCPDLFICL